jgi:hypothetical protein
MPRDSPCVARGFDVVELDRVVGWVGLFGRGYKRQQGQQQRQQQVPSLRYGMTSKRTNNGNNNSNGNSNGGGNGERGREWMDEIY